MGKHFFDFEDGDFAFSISDNMAMDSDGDLMMRMGNNMAMDMDTGDIHMISSWPNDDVAIARMRRLFMAFKDTTERNAMNYYISDLHIGHENILRFDNRPFADVNEMNNKLIENWNARVRSDDTVYILGDFIWAKESEWPSIVGSLGGNKVLIRGNHDPKQFSAVTKRMFQEITDLKEIKDSGKHVVMCHYPIPFFRASFASTAFMLYGHVHQTIEYEYIAKLRREVKANSTGYSTPNGNFINVGCMMPYMDYTPRTLDEIIEGDARYHEENPDAL